MSTVKLDTFLDMVRRSGLVESGQLDAALAELEQRPDPHPVSDSGVVCSHLIERGLLTGWQSERLLEGRHRGFFLGKYKLLDHLGSGGMSAVFLAEHMVMHRRVAIKVLPKHRVKDSSYLERFHREARAAAALDHPNIVRAYDVGNDGDVHYLVMEYVEGRDLQIIVAADGPRDPVQAVDYIRQAAMGLAHAHETGLIHRDIKPANLLIDLKGTVKILDMGLAVFSDDTQASLTIAHDEKVLGTVDYLPPEQAVDSHSADGRADIYSLGCTLYFALTGRPPFPEGTVAQRLMMHQTQMPTSIRTLRPEVPDDLCMIAEKMMAKQRDRRYQTADELVDVLGRWLADRGMAVDSPSRGVGSSGSWPKLGGGRRIDARMGGAQPVVINEDELTLAPLDEDTGKKGASPAAATPAPSAAETAPATRPPERPTSPRPADGTDESLELAPLDDAPSAKPAPRAAPSIAAEAGSGSGTAPATSDSGTKPASSTSPQRSEDRDPATRATRDSSAGRAKPSSSPGVSKSSSPGSRPPGSGAGGGSSPEVRKLPPGSSPGRPRSILDEELPSDERAPAATTGFQAGMEGLSSGGKLDDLLSDPTLAESGSRPLGTVDGTASLPGKKRKSRSDSGVLGSLMGSTWFVIAAGIALGGVVILAAAIYFWVSRYFGQ